MRTKHLKELLLVAGLVLSASMVVATDPPVTNSVQPAAAGVLVPQVFMAGLFDLQPKTNTAPVFDLLTRENPRVFWFSPITTKNGEAKGNLAPAESLDSRAWTTVVGWNAGKSNFPTAETHHIKLSRSWTF
jgi:hypothetical protein